MTLQDSNPDVIAGRQAALAVLATGAVRAGLARASVSPSSADHHGDLAGLPLYRRRRHWP
jgi:hypothetical protein